METESLVQPRRYFTFSETPAELAGVLEVPDHPEISTYYADIYHGIWITPQGDSIEVAIKEFKALIPRNRHSDPEALRRRADTRIKRETLVWSQTTHPNLHPLLGYRSEPQPRLISLWCSHGNLTDYLQANPGLSRLDKLRLIHQAASGLDHLHSLIPPICHADIKPENVLINHSYEAALSDFGLSRVLLAVGEPSGLTTSEMARGTLRYMAGELHTEEKRRPDKETDAYAFGGLILAVMSGKPPFLGLRESIILHRVIQNETPRPEDHPDLPPYDRLWNLIRCCWDKNPAARPSIREVQHQLWEDICHKQTDQQPTAGLLEVVNAEAREHSQMDVDASPETRQGGIRTLCAPTPVPVPVSVLVDNSTPRISDAEEPSNLNSGKLISAAQTVFRSLEVISKVVPVLGKYIRAAVEVGSMLVEIVQDVNRNRGMANALVSDTWNLAVLLDRLREQTTQKRQDNIGDCIADIQREFQGLQRKLKELYSPGFFNALSSSAHQEELKRWQSTGLKAWEAMEFLVNLDAAGLTRELGWFVPRSEEGGILKHLLPVNMELHEQHRRLLDRLGDGKYGGQGNMIEDVICFPGTRVNILDKVDNWIRDTSTPDRVLWIRGMAGRGKSTIASTVAHNWKHRASCAIFHFRRGQNTLNMRFVCALARQLGDSLVPEVRGAVLESVRENEDIAAQRLDEQFKTLLVAPIAKLNHQLHTVLFVVDALDECDNTKTTVDFVKLIDRHSSSFPPSVKFLLTCRPETPLLHILEPRRWNTEDLDSATDVSNDLERFIKHACIQIRDDCDLQEDWPSSEDLGRLVKMSQGLFQWARTAITYVSNGSPVDRLRSLLQRSSAWSGLDDLYHQILSKAFDNVQVDLERQEVLCRVLGTLVVAPYPVSLDVLATLYRNHVIFNGMDQQGIIGFLRRDLLADLNSLLSIPSSPVQPLCLMHTSIRDLLINKHRCNLRPYLIDIAEHHQRMASHCIGLMLQDLKENICNLSDLSKGNLEIQDAIERHLPKPIIYCCRAWSIHLTEGMQWLGSGSNSTRVRLADFELFSQEKVLCWLEVMSLVGAITEAIVNAKCVYEWLLRCPSEIYKSDSLTALWNDMQRFIITFSDPISFGAMHIYASALPHCPLKTQLWERYHSRATVRTVLGLQPLSWPSNLWTRYVGDPVLAIAFSPSGEILASGCHDGTIQLWETRTGMLLGEPMTGHNDWVWSVIFSPDGQVLMSGSEDGTIRMWSAQTGLPLGQPLINNGDPVRSIALSPDGKVLASVSEDGTIRLWDAQTGVPISQPWSSPTDLVRCVAFSPDGKVLASGSEAGSVGLWNTQTRTLLGDPMTRHKGWVWSVVFSPNGKVLASGAEDKTIRFWDVETGKPLGEPLTGHDDPVCPVAFSPDGNILASGSGDKTIRLWDMQTGVALPGHTLTGHSDLVYSVAFSPDSKVLASGSYDRTIRLWDAQIMVPLDQPLPGPSTPVYDIVFSPDGKVLASVSGLNLDPVIQLWDTQTGGALSEPIVDHTGWVRSVVFSPDSQVLASGSDDRTVRLWDTQTGVPLRQPLRGHTDSVYSVVFSPDGRILASGSGDKTIRLWDMQTGTPLGRPCTTGHSGVIHPPAFSPDGKILALGFVDGTIRLWDTQNGVPLGQLSTGENCRVNSVVFSPDGKVLASGSEGGTIRLWDTQAWTPSSETFMTPSWATPSVSFSRDSTIVVGGSLREYMIAWCISTRQNCEVPRNLPVRVRFEDQWVKYSSSRICWLPPQYWGRRVRYTTFVGGRFAFILDRSLFIFDASRALALSPAGIIDSM